MAKGGMMFSKKIIIALIVITVLIISLLYITLKEDTWKIQIIDEISSGESTIVVDSNNNPHVCYVDKLHFNLNYANWNKQNKTWEITTVDKVWSEYLSMAIDSKDIIHISYYDRTNHILKHAKYAENTWKIENLDNTGLDNVWSPIYTSIAIDSNDLIYIAYCYLNYSEYSTDKDLRMAKWNGQNWTITVVDSEGYVGKHCSIDIDTKGFPHICYQGNNHMELKYASWNGTSWNFEILDNYSGYISFKLDNHDYAHITYVQGRPFGEGFEGELKYATNIASNWSNEIIYYLDSYFTPTSLVLDNEENPHICYKYSTVDRANNTNGTAWDIDLHYIYQNGQEWIHEIVESEGKSGEYPSIAIDSNQRFHITYYDVQDRIVKYATKG